MRFINFFLSSLVLSIPLLVHADCININGLSFEKIDYNKLLAMRSGKNVAIIAINGPLPEKIGQFRFFSEQLCDYGAENKFHIDGKLFTILNFGGIQVYK